MANGHNAYQSAIGEISMIFREMLNNFSHFSMSKIPHFKIASTNSAADSSLIQFSLNETWVANIGDSAVISGGFVCIPLNGNLKVFRNASLQLAMRTSLRSSSVGWSEIVLRWIVRSKPQSLFNPLQMCCSPVKAVLDRNRIASELNHRELLSSLQALHRISIRGFIRYRGYSTTRSHSRQSKK